MAAHRSVILGIWSHWLIDKREILDLAVQTSLTPHVIEKDYVLGWMLAGIYAHEELAESWIHRGNLVGFFVIRSFRNKTTEAVFNGENPKGFPADLIKVARRKLRYLNAAGDLGDLRSPPGAGLRRSRAIASGNTRSASTTNSGYALFGRRKARRRSRSWTTTRRGCDSDQEAQAHASR
jgi:hypothetical protein